MSNTVALRRLDGYGASFYAVTLFLNGKQSRSRYRELRDNRHGCEPLKIHGQLVQQGRALPVRCWQETQGPN